jgi:hypothetical protein
MQQQPEPCLLLVASRGGSCSGTLLLHAGLIELPGLPAWLSHLILVVLQAVLCSAGQGRAGALCCVPAVCEGRSWHDGRKRPPV